MRAVTSGNDTPAYPTYPDRSGVLQPSFPEHP